jgi:glycosyltransferase involved in cell wall biosynthesis
MEDEEKITKPYINTGAIEYVPRDKPRYKILFLGHMYYPPNEECLKVIVGKILPELIRLDKRYTITIVGNTPSSTIQKYKNVEGLFFKGGMDNLSDLLAEYDMGIAPINQGSGTRLKILDYMASGLQVITTNLGVEGLDPNISKHLSIEDDLDKYPLVIHKNMENLTSYKEASMNAREFVELKYDWKNNLDPFLGLYKKLLNNK